MKFSALAITAAALPLALAYPRLEPRQSNSNTTSNAAFTCTEGSLMNITTIATFGYTGEQLTEQIGSFHNITWQSPVQSVNGTDNRPGATRTITAAGETLTETLIAYATAPNDTFAYAFNLTNGPLSFAALGNVTLYSYQEVLS